MKLNKNLLLALAGAAMVTAATAQDTTVTITGSTAIRGLIYDRIYALYTNTAIPTITSNKADQVTFKGLMTSVVASGNVIVRCSFSGSSEGLDAVVAGTPQATAAIAGETINPTNYVPDLAFSDIFAENAFPVPYNSGDFDDSQVCVLPFVWMKNNSLSNITDMTRDKALTLMGTSASNFPTGFYGGTNNITGGLLLCGRYNLSGTRVTIDRNIGFTGSPRYWMTNGLGGFTNGPGYSSGSILRDTVRNFTNTIGYLTAVASDITHPNTTVLTYNGVPFSPANVANGKYTIWCYEHCYNNLGWGSPNQIAVRDALVAAFQDPAYNTVNTLFTNSAVALPSMKVRRLTDGATITPLPGYTP